MSDQGRSDDGRDVGGLFRWNAALLAGFLLLVAVGVWSVLLPELEDAPEEPTGAGAPAAEAASEAPAPE